MLVEISFILLKINLLYFIYVSQNILDSWEENNFADPLI